MKYEKLFTPGKLGSMTVKNRIVMPPHGYRNGSSRR